MSSAQAAAEKLAALREKRKAREDAAAAKSTSTSSAPSKLEALREMRKTRSSTAPDAAVASASAAPSVATRSTRSRLQSAQPEPSGTAAEEEQALEQDSAKPSADSDRAEALGDNDDEMRGGTETEVDVSANRSFQGDATSDPPGGVSSPSPVKSPVKMASPPLPSPSPSPPNKASIGSREPAANQQSSVSSAELEELRDRLSTTERRLNESEAGKVELSNNVQSAVAAMEAMKRKHASEIADMKSKADSLTQQLEEAAMNEAELKKAVQKEKEKAAAALAEANKKAAAAPAAAPVESPVATDGQSAKRISELEAQVTELMDTLEMLTLDKEQLVLDNELLQNQLDEAKAGLKSGAPGSSGDKSAGAAGDASTLSEENNKLREALRRLHSQSTADRSELDALKAARESERSELETLKKFKENAESEMAELRQAVDAAASYESLIESLSEKNLDLTQKVSQLEVTVRDMEEQQELSEELDQQQRQELEHLRRQLDSASIQSAEKDSIIRGLESKVEEVKKLNDKYRRGGDQLKAELSELRGQVSVSVAESQRASERARAAASSQGVIADLQGALATLSAKFNVAQVAARRSQAGYMRLQAVYGRCSLQTPEEPLLMYEVACVATAAMGSAVCSAALQVIHHRGRNVTHGSGAHLSSPGPKPQSGAPQSSLPSSGTIQKVLLVLRATCISWQCAGAMLAVAGDESLQVDPVTLTSAAGSLRHAFERCHMAITSFSAGGSVFSGGVDDQSDLEDGPFTELSTACENTERMMSSLLSSVGGAVRVDPLPSFENLRKGAQFNSKVATNSKPLSDSMLSLSRFLYACKLSYLSAAADLLADIVEARVMHYNPAPGVTRDMCRNIRAELKSTGLLWNTGAGEALLTIKLKEVKGGKSTESMKVNEQVTGALTSMTVSLADCLHTLLGITAAVYVGNADTSGTEKSRDITAAISPAQLRACLASVGHVKALLTTAGAGTPGSPSKLSATTVGASASGPETISALNIASSEGADALWQLLLEAPEETTSSSLNRPLPTDALHSSSSSASGSLLTPMKAHTPLNTPSTPLGGTLSLSVPESSVIRAVWGPLAKWRSRALRRKELLHTWEKSVGEATSLRVTLDGAQTELKSRNDELRAAKAANSELEQIIKSQEEKFSKASEMAAAAPGAGTGSIRTTRSRGASSATAATASSSASAATAATAGDGSEVDKLKSEVKVLTSALSVLEIQFENAEKENKRLRGAKMAAGAGAGGGDNMASAASISAVVALAKSWRDIASHRLLNSMQPLPMPLSVIPFLSPQVLQSHVSPVDSTVSAAGATGEGANTPERVPEKTIVDPKKTYRDIRKLRSTLRINWNTSASAVGPTTTASKAGMMGLCWAGCEGRKDRVMLLEKFKNSLHVAQGAQLMC